MIRTRPYPAGIRAVILRIHIRSGTGSINSEITTALGAGDRTAVHRGESPRTIGKICSPVGTANNVIAAHNGFRHITVINIVIDVAVIIT